MKPMTPISPSALRFGWFVYGTMVVVTLIGRDWLLATIIVIVATAGTVWQLRHRPDTLSDAEPPDSKGTHD